MLGDVRQLLAPLPEEAAHQLAGVLCLLPGNPQHAGEAGDDSRTGFGAPSQGSLWRIVEDAFAIDFDRKKYWPKKIRLCVKWRP